MKHTPILNRDDDVSVYTCLCEFKKLHQVFIDKKQVHTTVVLMKDLWENQGMFYYLATAPYLEIGLHGWEHKDYSTLSYEECYSDLKKSLDYWKDNSLRMTGQFKEIKTFFAPWNREGDEIRQACADLGLNFCNVRKGLWNGYNVRSFHWWSVKI
jgi:peptidoglycan/xylan/chitin deacetylase (PgdA/CDA1 family)